MTDVMARQRALCHGWRPVAGHLPSRSHWQPPPTLSSLYPGSVCTLSVQRLSQRALRAPSNRIACRFLPISFVVLAILIAVAEFKVARSPGLTVEHRIMNVAQAYLITLCIFCWEVHPCAAASPSASCLAATSHAVRGSAWSGRCSATGLHTSVICHAYLHMGAHAHASSAVTLTANMDA